MHVSLDRNTFTITYALVYAREDASCEGNRIGLRRNDPESRVRTRDCARGHSPTRGEDSRRSLGTAPERILCNVVLVDV